MGIPHLIATLERYAIHEALEDESVVIDGPALAYHILHMCRANGVNQPSYDLLGRATIAWLDELQSSQVAIKSIYFDGYLPGSKQLVRMGRMIKGITQLKTCFSANPGGYPIADTAPKDEFDMDMFSLGRFGQKSFQDPSFLVPAIIDALRESSRYRALCFLVPGEADSYCAAYVARHGGIVITSDSDLLAYDLAGGKAVFLRDIHRSADSRLVCATFCPRDIHRSLGLPSSVEACRLAYELKSSPHAKLPRLLQACHQPLLDEVGYHNFRQQYLHHETASLPSTLQGNLLSLEGLDPRLSELLLQLGCSQADSSVGGGLTTRAFLPILIESPARGSAWEPSAPIRQLAYTLARRILTCPLFISVQEYRRVQTLDQKGRDISLMSEDATTCTISKLLSLMQQTREKARGIESNDWILLCLTLDILECEEQGRHSHALDIICQAGDSPAVPGVKVPWDIIHFIAQLQAGYYSLRILSQTLSIIPEDQMTGLNKNLTQIRGLLLKLPPLAEYPDVDRTIDFLRMAGQPRVIQVLTYFVKIPETSATTVTDARHDAKVKKKMKENKKRSNASRRLPLSPRYPGNGNIFSLLSGD